MFSNSQKLKKKIKKKKEAIIYKENDFGIYFRKSKTYNISIS